MLLAGFPLSRHTSSFSQRKNSPFCNLVHMKIPPIARQRNTQIGMSLNRFVGESHDLLSRFSNKYIFLRGSVNPRGGGGRGINSEIKMTGEGCSSYLLGVKIWRLVSLRVLKSKMSTVRIMAVPFIVLSRKTMTDMS